MAIDYISADKIYTAALAIMNETDADESYRDRAVPIINALLSQCFQYSEAYSGGDRSGWQPIDSTADLITGFDQTILLGVMPYGLAAALYIDEDPARANSWQQQYEEGLRNARRVPHGFEPIKDVYGCVDPTSYARW